MILVDTSVWIDHFKGRDTRQVAYLSEAVLQHEDICLCGLILTEILQGVRSDAEHKKVKAGLASLIFLPMTKPCYYLAAEIYRSAKANGETIRSSMDCLIAACAIEHGTHLLQADRDYLTIAKFSKLKIVEL